MKQKRAYPGDMLKLSTLDKSKIFCFIHLEDTRVMSKWIGYIGQRDYPYCENLFIYAHENAEVSSK
jgi:hypothetical protein